MRSPFRRHSRILAAATFALPLLGLLLVWEAIVRAFDVDQRVFPSIGPVVQAGLDAIGDGTLIRHIGASLGRIALGTTIGILLQEVRAPIPYVGLTEGVIRQLPAGSQPRWQARPAC